VFPTYALALGSTVAPLTFSGLLFVAATLTIQDPSGPNASVQDLVSVAVSTADGLAADTAITDTPTVQATTQDPSGPDVTVADLVP